MLSHTADIECLTEGRILRKTASGIILLSLVFSVFVLTCEIHPVKASTSMPETCELPRWLPAFLFILIVLTGGILVILVVFLLRCRKKAEQK